MITTLRSQDASDWDEVAAPSNLPCQLGLKSLYAMRSSTCGRAVMARDQSLRMTSSEAGDICPQHAPWQSILAQPT